MARASQSPVKHAAAWGSTQTTTTAPRQVSEEANIVFISLLSENLSSFLNICPTVFQPISVYSGSHARDPGKLPDLFLNTFISRVDLFPRHHSCILCVVCVYDIRSVRIRFVLCFIGGRSVLS